MLEFCRWNSDVEEEAAVGEVSEGGAALPGVGAGGGLCWEFRPRGAGPGEGDGDGEGEGTTVMGGGTDGGPPGEG